MYKLYKMSLRMSNSSISFTNDDDLKAIELIAIGKLIKTETGYSPLLLTKAVANSSEIESKLIDTEKTCLIMSSHDFALKPNETIGYCYFDGLSTVNMFAHISRALNIEFNKIYDHLLTGIVADRARVEGFFFFDAELGYFGDELFGVTMICDGRDDSGAWCMMIPRDITSDELASVIKNKFCAICGVIRNYNGDLSIYFFNKEYSFEGEEDYRHCITHFINEQDARGYYGPRTYGENRSELIEYLTMLRNSSNDDPFYANEIEKTLDNLRSIDDNDDDEPFPLTNRASDGTIPFITKPFCGTQFFLNLPFNIQLSACAKILNVSEEDMLTKLYTHSDSSMFE